MAHLKLEERIGSMKKSCVEILQIVNCRQATITTTLSQLSRARILAGTHARNKREKKTCARSIASVGRRGAASMAPQVSRAIVLRPSRVTRATSPPRTTSITTEVSLPLLQEQSEFDQHSIIHKRYLALGRPLAGAVASAHICDPSL